MLALEKNVSSPSKEDLLEFYKGGKSGDGDLRGVNFEGMRQLVANYSNTDVWFQSRLYFYPAYMRNNGDST